MITRWTVCRHGDYQHQCRTCAPPVEPRPPDPHADAIAQVEALLLAIPEERRGEALERFCRECLRVTDDRQCYCMRDD